MKKKVIALMLALSMAFTMTACGSQGAEAGDVGKQSEAADSSEDSKEGSGKEVTTVTIWSFYAEDQDETAISSRIQKLVNDFNASHDDVQAEISFGKSYDNVVTAIATESTPDIFQMYWQYASPLSIKGALADLTDYVNNDADFNKADIMDNVWNLCSVEDRIYSIPFSASTSYVLYNPSVLKAAGWEEFPATVEDLVQCAKDCYDVGGTTTMGLSPIFPWQDNVLWPAMMKAEWEDADGNPAFDSEAMRKAYSVQKELIDYQGGYAAVSAWGADYDSARGTASDPIFNGTCAMELVPDSDLARLFANGKEAGYEYGVDWDFSVVPGNSMLTAAVWEINSKSKDTDAAWEVLSYLSSTEAMAYLGEGQGNSGSFMPRVSALEALSNMDVADSVKEAANLLKNAELQSFPMSSYVNEYLNAIGNHTSEYLNGNLDIDTAFSNVQAEVEAAIKN